MNATRRPTCKLTKNQLAEALAKAMNLLNHLRASSEDGFPAREDDDFHEIAHVLRANQDVSESFWNNGTLRADELI